MPYSTPIARSTDREVLDVLVEIGGAFDFNNGSTISVSTPDNFFQWNGRRENVSGTPDLQQVLNLGGCVFDRMELRAGSPQQEVLRIVRPDNHAYDTLTIIWNNGNRPLASSEQFASLVGLAKDKLRQIKLNAGASALGVEDLDAYVKARAAELHDLQMISADILKKAHARTAEIEEERAQRLKAQDAAFTDLQRKGQEEIDRQKAEAERIAKERLEALAAREAELDKSEAKYARRQLRLDLLKILQGHSDRFQLSASTRRLRWPTFALLIIAIAATGYLTFLSFFDLAAAIGSDQTPWWRIAMVSAKQLFFAVTFLGLATYFLRWLESWSRRHADAEFYFKQLELDLNRASWVVEIAAEWREKEGAELPKELLAQLANHLFSEPGFAAEVAGGESALASILGGATNLKLSTPGGGHLEIGRSGIRKVLS